MFLKNVIWGVKYFMCDKLLNISSIKPADLEVVLEEFFCLNV